MGDGTCLFLMPSLEICRQNLSSVCRPHAQPAWVTSSHRSWLEGHLARIFPTGSPEIVQAVLRRGSCPPQLSLLQILMEVASLSLWSSWLGKVWSLKASKSVESSGKKRYIHWERRLGREKGKSVEKKRSDRHREEVGGGFAQGKTCCRNLQGLGTPSGATPHSSGLPPCCLHLNISWAGLWGESELPLNLLNSPKMLRPPQLPISTPGAMQSDQHPLKLRGCNNWLLA